MQNISQHCCWTTLNRKSAARLEAYARPDGGADLDTRTLQAYLGHRIQSTVRCTELAPGRVARMLLPCTQLVERLKHRIDLLTVWGIWVHLLKSVHQRDIFGSQLCP